MSRPSRAGLEWALLGLLGLVAAAFLLYETRGTTFWFDEWTWVTERRGYDPGTFLRPHNEHFSLIPVAIYKLLFSTAGLEHYEAFRVLMTVGHVGLALLLFVYARVRVGAIPALCAVALLCFFGAAWQNILWPFQVAWVISLAAAVGALLMLDRSDRRGDVAACGLLAVALAGSGLGIAVATGLLAEILLGRRGWRRAWIVLAPLAAYGLWWLWYLPAGVVRQNLDLTPRFVVDIAASTLGGLTGLAGHEFPSQADPLAWGRPLLLMAVAGLVWRTRVTGQVAPRVACLLTMLLSFWVLTGLRRASFGDPEASRYLYVGGVLMLGLALELARGTVLSAKAAVLLLVATAAAALSGAGTLRDAGRELRTQAETTRASLGAIELARERVRGGHVARGVFGYPLVQVRADRYFASVDAHGSPAFSPQEIASSPEPARLAADAELIRVHRVGLRPEGGGTSAKTTQRPTNTEGVTVRDTRGCQRVEPSAVQVAGAIPAVEFVIPAGGLRLSAEGGSAKIAVRRFADGLSGPVRDTLAASAVAVIRIPPDRDPRPWRVRVEPERSVTICALG